jgi:hypothetical protein
MSRNQLAAVLALATASLAGVAHAGELPPPQNARPGECYGKVILPATYSVSKRQELVREAWKLSSAPVRRRSIAPR